MAGASAGISKRTKWIGGALGAYGLGVAAWLFYSSAPKTMPSDADRLLRFRQIASQYDSKVSETEKRLGLEEHRSSIVGQARGRVLEVGAGSCRNLALYGKAVQGLVLTDAAAEMIEQCRAKVAAMAPARRARLPESIEHVCAEAEKLPFAAQEFDTVVDTFSLCSVRDVPAALKEMERVLRPDGRLLLLEHGLSPYWPVNVYLNATAASHARHWGCWWNRPLEEAITASGLEIVELRRAHLGTSLIVVAKPRPSSASSAHITSPTSSTLSTVPIK